MIKNIGRQLMVVLPACVLTAALVLLYLQYNGKKIAVVDAIQLFNEFKMKQELEGRAAAGLQLLSHRADSIRQELAMRSQQKNISQDQLAALAASFRQAQTQLEQQYQQSNQEINETVWKRLNPLVDEYGKAGGYRLIIGANGMGSVLYNDDYYDRTKEVIRFVNEHYEKGN